MAEYIPASAIIQSLKAVFWLYQHCVDPQNAADRKYKEFGVAIRGLDQAVTHLQKTLQRSNRFHGAPVNGIHGASTQQYEPTLAATATEIVKEFKAMLMDCELLLADNAYLQSSSANFLQNIVWGASTQDQVDALQGRIAAQIQNILLLQSTIAFDANHNVAEQVQFLARNQDPTFTEENLSIDPFPLSNGLIYRLRQASWRDPPQGFKSPDEFPLDQGFYALFAHLQQSTTLSAPGTRQTIHQYVSLLKAQWILQTTKQQRSFKNLAAWESDRIDAQYFENIIAGELRREDLTIWSYEDIKRLPDSHFFIWDTRPMNVLQDQMSPSKDEKRIHFTSLPSPPGYNGYELAIFRGLKVASGTGVRLVRKLTAANPEVLLPPEPLRVDAFTDKLIPLYALPTSRDERYSLRLQKPGFTEGSPYEFDGIKDVFKLQWALTCYTVVSDFENVDWAVARSSMFNKSPNGQAGRVQIWLWDPDDALAEAAASSSSDSGSDNQSLVSQLTGQSAVTILQDSEEPHVSVSTKSQTKYSNIEVVEAVMPYEPLIIVYTRVSGRYCYLCLELSGEIYIDPTNCNCSKRPDKCDRIVFKSRLGNLTVKRVMAKSTDSEGIPNLNIFARSFRKGQAAHPDLGDDQIVEKITGGHITLDFASVAMRKRFNKHFALALKLRQSIESTDKLLEHRAKFVSNKPEGRGNPRERIIGQTRTNTMQSSRVSSIYSDRTARQNDNCPSPYSRTVDPQPSSYTDQRHDSAMFSGSPSLASRHSRQLSEAPSEVRPSELRDRNGSPTELDGDNSSWYSRDSAVSNQRSSNGLSVGGANSSRTDRLSRQWDPDPGGSRSARSRPSEYLSPPSELSSDREISPNRGQSPSPVATRVCSLSSTSARSSQSLQNSIRPLSELE